MVKAGKIVMAVVLVAIVALMFTACSVFSVDKNASFHCGTGELIWNDTRYVDAGILGTGPSKKVLARVPDHAVVHELAEDPSHTFLMVRHGGNTYYAVREDYVVPTEGDITAFVWGDTQYVTDEAACNALQEVVATADTMPTFYFETDNLYQYDGDAQRIKTMYVAYEGCPAATDFVGHIGKVNGKTVYITEGTETSATHRGGGPATIPIKCHEIPEPLATTIASRLKFE